MMGCDLSSPTTQSKHAEIPNFIGRVRPGLIEDLLQMPQLRMLHLLSVSEYTSSGRDLFLRLDDIQMEDTATLRANSVRSGGRELFYCTQLRPFAETANHPIAERLSSLPLGFHAEDFRTASGQREFIYYRLPTPQLSFSTYYEGYIVPYHILERLKKAEGKPEPFWRGRGIQVREETWAVVMDWAAEELADEEAGDTEDGLDYPMELPSETGNDQSVFLACSFTSMECS